MGFKDQVKTDISKVFLNTDEFAETHTIKFDGEVYEGVPLVLEKVRQTELSVSVGNHSEGLHLVAAKAYFGAAITGGLYPERGKRFEIDDGEALGEPFFRRYTVATAEDAMGMIYLELEACDE